MFKEYNLIFLVSKLDFCFKFPILPGRNLIMINLGVLSLLPGLFSQFSVFPNPGVASRFRSFPWFTSLSWHLPWQHLLCHVSSLSPHRWCLPYPKYEASSSLLGSFWAPLRRHQQCVEVPLCILGPQGILWCFGALRSNTVCSHCFSSTTVLSGAQDILKKCAAVITGVFWSKFQVPGFAGILNLLGEMNPPPARAGRGSQEFRSI